MSWTCRVVMPPDTGMTVARRRRAADVLAAIRETPRAVDHQIREQHSSTPRRRDRLDSGLVA